MTADHLVTIAVALAAIPASLFPLLYSWWPKWFQWRHTELGRHLFWFTAGLAVPIDLALFRRLLGEEFPGYDWLVFAVFLVICWQLYRRLWFLFKNNSPHAQRKYAAEAEAKVQAEESNR